jgi:hypothetical protein
MAAKCVVSANVGVRAKAIVERARGQYAHPSGRKRNETDFSYPIDLRLSAADPKPGPNRAGASGRRDLNATTDTVEEIRTSIGRR